MVIGYLILSLLTWLGLASPPACQLGRGMSALLASRLLESLVIICLVAWGLTLFTWHIVLLWALAILFSLSWAAAQIPALLATC